MSQSQVFYNNLLVVIQLSSSISRIGFAAHAFDFLSKMSLCSRAERASRDNPSLARLGSQSEQGSEFPASGELREVFARSARQILLVARLARLIANPGQMVYAISKHDISPQPAARCQNGGHQWIRLVEYV
jgi:hypothetical protein